MRFEMESFRLRIQHAATPRQTMAPLEKRKTLRQILFCGKTRTLYNCQQERHSYRCSHRHSCTLRERIAHGRYTISGTARQHRRRQWPIEARSNRLLRRPRRSRWLAATGTVSHYAIIETYNLEALRQTASSLLQPTLIMITTKINRT